MPRYYCEYCDAYLTHDSASVRKTHNSGKKHKDNVRAYYQEWYDKNQHKLMEQGVLIPGQGFVGTVPPVGGLESLAGPGQGGGRYDRYDRGPRDRDGLMGNRPPQMPPNMQAQFAQMMAMGMPPMMMPGMPPGMMPPGMMPGMMPPGMMPGMPPGMMAGMMPGMMQAGSGADSSGGHGAGRDSDRGYGGSSERSQPRSMPREPRDRNDREWFPPRNRDRDRGDGYGGGRDDNRSNNQFNGPSLAAPDGSMGGIHPSRLAAMQRAATGR